VNPIPPELLWKLVEEWKRRASITLAHADERKATVAAVADVAVALTVDRLAGELGDLLARLGRSSR
jgi:hypothetical protein